MATFIEKGSSSSRSNTPLMPGRIVVAYDATKNHNIQEFQDIISNIRRQDGMIEEVDTITVLGILHKVLHPMGFQIQIGSGSFIRAHARAIEEDVTRKVDEYVGKLQHSAEECAGNRVDLEVKIVVGAPVKKVVVQEVAASNATWVVLDRHLRKELRFYLKHISCKVAVVLDNLSLEIFRPYFSDKATDNIKHKPFYSLSKFVPSSPAPQCNENDEIFVSAQSYNESLSSQTSPTDRENNSLITSELTDQSLFFSLDEFGSDLQLKNSGLNAEVKEKNEKPTTMKMEKQLSPQSYSDVPAITAKSELQIATVNFSNDNLHKQGGDSLMDLEAPENFTLDEMKMGLESVGCSYPEIKIATNDFSFDNLLGEFTSGVVYKGQLKNGQLIAVKVQKESNTERNFKELRSEVDALRLALHKNIVMLLGYCSRENVNILVYEYICNRSLEWHLFDNTKHVLEWYQRHAIAIGIAKGLRFLHEECRGSPIVHRDLRPSKILLTHDFVPMLGDYGLAKWNINKSDKPTELLGSLQYHAPEYAENGICSTKSDVFAFGIVLIQLISGRKAARDNSKQSLREWALPLIEKLAIDDLIDPRLGDEYSMYELYQMAKAAYLCAQPEPANRPTMSEVLCLLEGKNDHLRLLTDLLIPDNRDITRVLAKVLMV